MINIKEELTFIKARNTILKQFDNLAEEKGFIKVESDYFENYDDFKELNQRQNTKEFIKVQDLRGNLFLLQPDITSNIIKQVIPRIESDMTLELFYSDNIFYYDAGEIVTKRQFGVEVIGEEALDADVKMIRFIKDIFEIYEIDYAIEIGNQAVINIIIQNMNLSQKDANQLKRLLIDKNKHDLKRYLRSKNTTNYNTFLLACIDKQNQLDELIDDVKRLHLDERLLLELQKLNDIANEIKQDNVWFDLSIVNQYDYYNGPIYKGYIKGYKEEVLSGGRYDYLTVEFGSLTRALGFSLDMNVFINEVINNG
ncbi:MAG: ATP phosphoribosyltransferase regulatory subunit [Candidatus Izemoplasma sp.]|nr:ATP phosphoribosyltransferase regulatory subunit [Candidatus Izemoplasma sp.]